MLNLKERFRVLVFFRYCCIVNLFPVQVDLESWQIIPGTDTKWKRWASQASYGLFIAHSLYISLRLVYATLVLHDIPLHQMVIHAVYAGAAVYVLWWYILYYEHVEVNAGIRKLTLTRPAKTGNYNSN